MTTKLKPIEQQVMVITGASSGVGLTTALTAAKAGARVVLAARGDALESIVERIRQEGGEAIAVRTDVAERPQLEQLAKAAVDRFGRIDTWVNDAGVAIYGRLDEVSEADSRKLFDTNFWGIVNGSLVALPYLKASCGAPINIGSEVSEAVVPLQGMYSASKHAVKGFTDALRVEVELVDKTPMAITLIQPTAVNTPYPQHARNYMAEEPKLPSPQIDPQQVADAIIDAATHHRRDVKVGAVAVINTFIGKIAPSLADRMCAKQVGNQQYGEPPRAPEGTLTNPGGAGKRHGSGGAVNSRPSKVSH